jgi:hypothetical protein
LFCRLLGNVSLALVVLLLFHALGSVSAPPSALPRISFSEADVEYCASRFYFYSPREVQMLDHSLFHQIMASPSLSLLSEDSLLALLLDLSEDCRDLLNCVEIRYLSDTGISVFVDQVPLDI